jgi:tetratricopeptide (TPR) repeat protein
MATVKEALQTALAHHQAGRLPDAERLYREVLKVEPQRPDALHLLGVLAHQVGKFEPALQYIGAAIAAVPTQPIFHASLSSVYLSLGQLDQALASCQQALRLKPDSPEGHYSLANVRRVQGRMAEAEAAYRQVLRLQPEHADAHNNLGNVLHSRAQVREAESCYREALRLKPGNAATLANLGSVLREQGQFDQAEALLRHALSLRPQLALAQSYLGDVLLDRGRLGDAERCYREALRQQPNLAESQRGLGVALHRQGRCSEAETYYRQAIALWPAYTEAHRNLGDLMLGSHDIPAARHAYQEVIRHQPDAAEVHNNLGACLIHEGRTTEAVYHLHEALRLRPDYVPSLGNLGTLARDGFYQMPDAEVALLRRLLAAGNLSAEPRSTLAFSLANVLDKRKQYDEAFACYRQANELKREVFWQRGLGFDAADHRRFVDQVIATATPGFFRTVAAFGLSTELPVFIVGMPRSGTTLVEQILASHPEVYGAGELADVPEVGADLGRSLQPPQNYPGCLARFDAAAVRAAATRQLDRLSQLGGAAACVTDKLPANIFHLALIYVLFPKARIIHCLRDALDTCLSCFIQDFTTLSFATRLEDIAAYYKEYERLAAHWRAVYPAPVFEVRYENLIADQEGVSRQLVAYLGLEWDDRCLAFHETKRVVETSSVAQVRQPIYRSAVGRWQRYRQHLGPLFEALGWQAEGDARGGIG